MNNDKSQRADAETQAPVESATEASVATASGSPEAAQEENTAPSTGGEGSHRQGGRGRQGGRQGGGRQGGGRAPRESNLKPQRPQRVIAAEARGTYEMKGIEVSIRTLMEAGSHFGHETARWSPKMLPFIYGVRNNVHILNLDITLQKWREARQFIVKKMAEGGGVLFVGTKIQAREPVIEEAVRCGGYFVTSRWLGGTLTNFETIRRSLERMKKLEDLLEESQREGSDVKLNKKEKLYISRQLARLDGNIGGIRAMKGSPDILFVVDINKEHIAIAEAKRLGIPVVAIVDSNTNPAEIDFPIPANDDSAKSIRLFAAAVADAVIEGRSQYEMRMNRDDSHSDTPRSNRSRARGGDSREVAVSKITATADSAVAS